MLPIRNNKPLSRLLATLIRAWPTILRPRTNEAPRSRLKERAENTFGVAVREFVHSVVDEARKLGIPAWASATTA
jgi:hypothetical protein